MSKVLYRAISELRSNTESRTITGYAIVFESWSRDLGGFYEIIRKGAITQELINRSDVIMNVNHDNDKMVARSVNGEGTLKLTLDDTGLRFEFEAPPTPLGEELLFNIRSGNLFECSFAFSLSGSDTCERWTKDENMLRREILEIGGIYDCSIVTCAAYGATSCHTRGLETEIINTQDILRNMDNKEKLNQLEEEIKKLRAEMEAEEEKPAEEPVEEPTEEEAPVEEEKPAEEPIEEKEEPADEEKPAEELPEEEERNKTNINKSNIRKMEKRFSLVKEIRNAMDKGNQINLAELNKRAYTVSDEGVDVVETDIFDIIKPLYDKNVLVAAGAKFMTGLVGDVQVPVMAGVAATWEGETAETTAGAGSFTQVKLSPKRLSVRVPVSLQLLAQDGIGVENAIREDIINAVNQKLEATILGDAAGSTSKPAGLFYSATKNNIADFGDIADLEATVEAAKIEGNCKYIVSPKAKAALRATIKGTNATGMVFENNAIDGVEALSTGHVAAGDLVYGDFSQLLIGAWGDVTLDVVRDSAYLSQGQVCIIVNAYFDAKPARLAAFAFGTVNAPANTTPETPSETPSGE